MLRQSFIYLILSIFVVIFASYAQVVVVYLDMLYTYVNLQLAPVFSSSETGVLIRQMFSLVLIPVIIACLPALAYRAIKGQHMPYFIEVTWLLWLVIVLSKVLIR
jgi:hypothetical protein